MRVSFSYGNQKKKNDKALFSICGMTNELEQGEPLDRLNFFRIGVVALVMS